MIKKTVRSTFSVAAAGCLGALLLVLCSDVRAQQGSGDGTEDSAGDELREECRVVGVREPMSATADERDKEAERDVGADDLRWGEWGEAEKGCAA